jgi:hypothetical protein
VLLFVTFICLAVFLLLLSCVLYYNYAKTAGGFLEQTHSINLTKCFWLFILNFARGVDGPKRVWQVVRTIASKKQSGLSRIYRDLAPNKLDKVYLGKVFLFGEDQNKEFSFDELPVEKVLSNKDVLLEFNFRLTN